MNGTEDCGGGNGHKVDRFWGGGGSASPDGEAASHVEVALVGFVVVRFDGVISCVGALEDG